MMQLRCLQPQDAPLMLEWMHDPDAVRYMRADFSGMTLADCERFIAAAQQDTPCLHRAVADGAGVYQGTVSLKNCDAGRGEAEFAIAVRRCAMAMVWPHGECRQFCSSAFRSWGCAVSTGALLRRMCGPAVFMQSRDIPPSSRSRTKTVCSGLRC